MSKNSEIFNFLILVISVIADIVLIAFTTLVFQAWRNYYLGSGLLTIVFVISFVIYELMERAGSG